MAAYSSWSRSWLGTLVLFASFVIDIGNWFEHKRHLQLQADAGALAGGGLFNQCISSSVGTATLAIEAEARKYAGSSYAGALNEQVGGLESRHRLHAAQQEDVRQVGGPGTGRTPIDDQPLRRGRCST